MGAAGREAAGTFSVHRSGAARAVGAPGFAGQDTAAVLARAGVRDGSRSSWVRTAAATWR